MKDHKIFESRDQFILAGRIGLFTIQKNSFVSIGGADFLDLFKAVCSIGITWQIILYHCFSFQKRCPQAPASSYSKESTYALSSGSLQPSLKHSRNLGVRDFLTTS